MWSIGKLLHIYNVELLVIAPHDKFTMLLSFVFCRKTLQYNNFCHKNLNSEPWANKMAYLHCVQTPTLVHVEKKRIYFRESFLGDCCSGYTLVPVEWQVHQLLTGSHQNSKDQNRTKAETKISTAGPNLNKSLRNNTKGPIEPKRLKPKLKFFVIWFLVSLEFVRSSKPSLSQWQTHSLTATLVFNKDTKHFKGILHQKFIFAKNSF